MSTHPTAQDAARAAAISILRDLRDVLVFDADEHQADAMRGVRTYGESNQRYAYTVRVVTLSRYITVTARGEHGVMIDDGGEPFVKVIYPAEIPHTDLDAFTEALRAPLRAAVDTTMDRVVRARQDAR